MQVLAEIPLIGKFNTCNILINWGEVRSLMRILALIRGSDNYFKNLS